MQDVIDGIKPAFEIRMPDGQHIKIYSSGKVDGVEGDFVIFNRIHIMANMILALQAKAE